MNLRNTVGNLAGVNLTVGGRGRQSGAQFCLLLLSLGGGARVGGWVGANNAACGPHQKGGTLSFTTLQLAQCHSDLAIILPNEIIFQTSRSPPLVNSVSSMYWSRGVHKLLEFQMRPNSTLNSLERTS